MHWSGYFNPRNWFSRPGTSAGTLTPVNRREERGKPELGPVGARDTAGQSTGTGFSWLCGYGDRPASTPATYLSVLLDPVLAAARMYALNPIKVGKGRCVARDDAPDGARDFIENVTKPLLTPYVEDAAWAVDMGWSGFQNVWAREDGKYVLTQIIACRQESNSGVLVSDDTGAKLGVKWNGVDLFGHKSFVYTHDRRGQNWLGQSRLENVIDTISQWREANQMTAKMGRKAGGIVVMVGYPPGEGRDSSGNAVKRSSQADTFGQGITSGSAYGTYPLLGGLTEDKIRSMAPADLIKFLELSMWQFKMLDLGDPGTSIASMTAEKRYLDELKCLGYGVPPQAILHGLFGARADSASKGNSGTAMNEPVNRGIYCALNEGSVNSLLALNWGAKARGTVAWEPEPLEDPQAVFDRQILTTVMQGSDVKRVKFLARLFGVAAIAERNGLPFDEDVLNEPDPVQPVVPAAPRIAASANGLNGDTHHALRGAMLLGRIMGEDE